MNDDQLEDALRKYQPRQPDASVRSRVLSARPSRVPLRLVDWMLLAAAASLAIAAAWPQPTPDRIRDPVAAAYRERLEDATLTLGGDLQARQLALIVVNAGLADAAGDEQ